VSVSVSETAIVIYTVPDRLTRPQECILNGFTYHTQKLSGFVRMESEAKAKIKNIATSHQATKIVAYLEGTCICIIREQARERVKKVILLFSSLI
jgi:hypothetical protein